jgi:hypothetical protein
MATVLPNNKCLEAARTLFEELRAIKTEHRPGCDMILRCSYFQFVVKVSREDLSLESLVWFVAFYIKLIENNEKAPDEALKIARGFLHVYRHIDKSLLTLGSYPTLSADQITIFIKLLSKPAQLPRP